MGLIGDKKGEWITVANTVLGAEALAIAAAGRLDQNLAKAVKMILDHPGKVVVRRGSYGPTIIDDTGEQSGCAH